ncbi:10953_t:CDS:2, partial [Cetraspora pellucida]
IVKGQNDALNEVETNSLSENEIIEQPIQTNKCGRPSLADNLFKYLDSLNTTILTEEDLTDDQIVQLVLKEEKDHSESDNSEFETLLISVKKVYDALKTWIEFFEQQNHNNFDVKDLKIFYKYSNITHHIYEGSKKQTKIQTFFNHSIQKSTVAESEFVQNSASYLLSE